MNSETTRRPCRVTRTLPVPVISDDFRLKANFFGLDHDIFMLKARIAGRDEFARSQIGADRVVGAELRLRLGKKTEAQEQAQGDEPSTQCGRVEHGLGHLCLCASGTLKSNLVGESLRLGGGLIERGFFEITWQSNIDLLRSHSLFQNSSIDGIQGAGFACGGVFGHHLCVCIRSYLRKSLRSFVEGSPDGSSHGG